MRKLGSLRNSQDCQTIEFIGEGVSADCFYHRRHTPVDDSGSPDKTLFGSLADGIRSLAPYRWQLESGEFSDPGLQYAVEFRILSAGFFEVDAQ